LKITARSYYFTAKLLILSHFNFTVSKR